jgi:hypothetical protein
VVVVVLLVVVMVLLLLLLSHFLSLSPSLSLSVSLSPSLFLPLSLPLPVNLPLSPSRTPPHRIRNQTVLGNRPLVFMTGSYADVAQLQALRNASLAALGVSPCVALRSSLLLSRSMNENRQASQEERASSSWRARPCMLIE